MKKVLFLVALAISCFAIFGFIFQGGFSLSLLVPIIIGIGLLLWASFELLDWYNDNNRESNILCVLDSARGYQVLGETVLGGFSVQILIELDTKKKRIALIKPGLDSGFAKIQQGTETFWVPPGKMLVRGKVEDCVFAPILLDQKKEQVWGWSTGGGSHEVI